MNKISGALMTILFLTLNLTACSNNNATVNNPQIQKSQNSQPKKELAQRVVALTPLAADLIYNLDRNKLVGIPNSRETSTS